MGLVGLAGVGLEGQLQKGVALVIQHWRFQGQPEHWVGPWVSHFRIRVVQVGVGGHRPVVGQVDGQSLQQQFGVAEAGSWPEIGRP